MEVFEELEEFEDFAEYAREKGFQINPNTHLAKEIVAKLKENKEKLGYCFCPSKEITGFYEKDKKNICPCDSHEEELYTQGHCTCELFVI
ncbi:MAG: ferredoxin-thioredoxin reductase catalytic domain-containing protein [Nanoarchaeota archaeon]